MKFHCSVILVLVVSFTTGMEISLSPEDKQKLMDIHNACAAETGVSADLVHGAMKGNFPDDPTLKEHLFCMTKKLGFQNENGEIQKDVLASHLSKYVTDPTMLDKIMNCKAEQGTPQDTAVGIAKCAFQSQFVLA